MEGGHLFFSPFPHNLRPNFLFFTEEKMEAPLPPFLSFPEIWFSFIREKVFFFFPFHRTILKMGSFFPFASFLPHQLESRNFSLSLIDHRGGRSFLPLPPFFVIENCVFGLRGREFCFFFLPTQHAPFFPPLSDHVVVNCAFFLFPLFRLLSAELDCSFSFPGQAQNEVLSSLSLSLLARFFNFVFFFHAHAQMCVMHVPPSPFPPPFTSSRRRPTFPPPFSFGRVGE